MELVSGLELDVVVAGSGVSELARDGEDSMGERGKGSFLLVEGSITSLYKCTSFRTWSESARGVTGGQTKGRQQKDYVTC